MLIVRNDLVKGDWIKMEGTGFVIYGKVTHRDPESGELQIITSSIANNVNGIAKPSQEMELVKIDQKEVPQRARLWILSRISNPPKGPDADPNSRYLSRP